ncbi:MAG TPA: peptide ABC transporter permease [Ruminococcaceae bacterium]|jgi:peptide/nickel transport system permease protein|nr:peptide ABC transporter permease [Oscillospiraceae bacterium]
MKKKFRSHDERRFQLYFGIVLTAIVLLLAVVGIFYAPYDPYAMNSVQRFQPPSLLHLFGTDQFGRDNFSRAMTGARYSLLVAAATVALSGSVGITIGLFIGYEGGAAEAVVMRLTDALASFPGVLLALVAVTAFGGGRYTIIPALAIAFLPSYIRIARSGAKQCRNREFIEAECASDISTGRILFKHILPNIVPSVVPALVIGFSNAILAESGMSYLGLGIQPPIPSWGRMLAEGQAYLLKAPWESLSAGFMIFLTVLGFHNLGDGLSK